MQDDFMFILRLCLFAAFHSLFAIPSVKKFIIGDDQSHKQYYRLAYNILSLALLAWIMATSLGTRVLFVVPGIWSLVMHLIQLIFLLTGINCIRQTGAREFLGLPQKPGTEAIHKGLITEGCYGVVRHPLYLLSILLMLFSPVINTHWIIFTLFSTAYFIIGALIEERRLSRDFGEQYRIYKNRVPFIIPDLHKTARLPSTTIE